MEHAEKTYRISGLDCASCALKAEKALENCKGIESCHIDYAGSKIYVTGLLTKEECEAEIRKVEEEVRLFNMEENADWKKERRKMIVVALRAFISFLLAILTQFLLPVDQYGVAPYLSLMITAWLLSGYDLLYFAGKAIFKGKDIFNESFLMSFASIGAFLLPLLNHDFDSCFDAVLVVVLYQIGELFNDYATRKSHQAVVDALSLKKEVIHRRVNDIYEDIPASSAKRGDYLLIKLGESVPVDGVIKKGKAEIDLSSLTGEFAPKFVEAGDKVVSSAIVKTGYLEIEAITGYQDSTSSKLVELVEGASREKGKTEKLIDRFARYYTPIVIALAVILAVIPPLFINYSNAEVWANWATIALSLLVISCPCAIVLSIPLCYFSAVGSMGKNGILLKGTEYIDVLASTSYLVSDKTGTLTEGRFSLEEVCPNEISKKELLELIALAEHRSNHPLAQPFKPYFDSLKEKEINSYEEIPGKGITLSYQNKKLLVGTKKLLEENGILVPSEVEGTLIYASYNQKYIGYVTLVDSYKDGSKSLFSYCNEKGIHTLLLTGDQEKAAKKAQSDLGIGEVYSQLLPEEKTNIIREKKSKLSKNKTLLYVGDGINDAASLALADCGVAMGALGSGLAIDAADVLLMNDDPSSIAKGISIAKKTKSLAYFILAFALIIKFIIMIISLVLGSSFPLWVAVFGDTGLTLITILLSLIPLVFTKGKRKKLK